MTNILKCTFHPTAETHDSKGMYAKNVNPQGHEQTKEDLDFLEAEVARLSAILTEVNFSQKHFISKKDDAWKGEKGGSLVDRLRDFES